VASEMGPNTSTIPPHPHAQQGPTPIQQPSPSAFRNHVLCPLHLLLALLHSDVLLSQGLVGASRGLVPPRPRSLDSRTRIGLDRRSSFCLRRASDFRRLRTRPGRRALPVANRTPVATPLQSAPGHAVSPNLTSPTSAAIITPPRRRPGFGPHACIADGRRHAGGDRLLTPSSVPRRRRHRCWLQRRCRHGALR
jgi:hypothetical protein